MKILLTSDLHLGMSFRRYPEVSKELRESRFRTLDNLVNLANREKCDLFVIAGDLFDKVRPAEEDIVKAVKSLDKLDGPLAVVLPGNHDYITPGVDDLWRRFEELMGDNLLLLKEPRVYGPGDHQKDLCIYAAPCGAKHSSENSIGWIQHTRIDRSITYHIGVAHGSLDGFSPDFDSDYYPMTEKELHDCALDLWLLGHTHKPFPSESGHTRKICLAGTPEPDGFDCTHEGSALLLEINEAKRVLYTIVKTGICRFKEEQVTLGRGDTRQILDRLVSQNYARTLLKLSFTGMLPGEEWELLVAARKKLEASAFYLRWNQEELKEMITQERIDCMYTEGSFPHRLLSKFAAASDREALQLAYDLIGGVAR